MDKEAINTIFEGIISLAVILGAGYMATTHADSVALVGMASAAAMSVITFWFGQRGQVKAVNGNITALANIASQVNTTREQAATTAATTALRAATVQAQVNHPEGTP